VGTVISTPAVDRERDVIMQDGWDLEHYQKNPVVLWAHDYWSPPVARSVDLYNDSGGNLAAVDRFTPQDVNPFGYMVYRLVQGGFLRAKSVGFRPLEWTVNEDHGGYDFLKNELLEHSWVPVPANPEALVQAGAQGIDVAPLRQWAEQVLDKDPSWGSLNAVLPRNVLETVWKQAGYVVGSPTVVTNTASPPDGDGAQLQTHTLTWTTTDYPIVGAGGAGTGEVVRHAEQHGTDLEDIMDEAKVDELIAALAGTTAALEEHSKVLGTFAEATTKTNDAPPDPPEEVDADAVAALVKDAVAEAMTAHTGQLPE
jgi:HK97 family phage prohead protease